MTASKGIYLPRKATASEKVAIRSRDEGDCRVWTGHTVRGGYGRLSWRGRSELAHRVAYEGAYGRPPDDMKVCHRCDNPACVKPEHLFLGTQADNMADAAAKGRQSKGEMHSATLPKGERNHNAKLTAADVRTIRRSALTGYQLAQVFGVSEANVSRIRNGQMWRHVA